MIPNPNIPEDRTIKWLEAQVIALQALLEKERNRQKWFGIVFLLGLLVGLLVGRWS